MNILGINAYHGNASAALVCDGKLVAAVEEERFNRVKYAAGFPAPTIRYCQNDAGITLATFNPGSFCQTGSRGYFARIDCRARNSRVAGSSHNPMARL